MESLEMAAKSVGLSVEDYYYYFQLEQSQMQSPPVLHRITSQSSVACMACGVRQSIHRCSVCRVTQYCSSSCRDKHWHDDGHKRYCATVAGILSGQPKGKKRTRSELEEEEEEAEGTAVFGDQMEVEEDVSTEERASKMARIEPEPADLVFTLGPLPDDILANEILPMISEETRLAMREINSRFAKLVAKSFTGQQRLSSSKLLALLAKRPGLALEFTNLQVVQLVDIPSRLLMPVKLFLGELRSLDTLELEFEAPDPFFYVPLQKTRYVANILEAVSEDRTLDGLPPIRNLKLNNVASIHKDLSKLVPLFEGLRSIHLNVYWLPSVTEAGTFFPPGIHLPNLVSFTADHVITPHEYSRSYIPAEVFFPILPLLKSLRLSTNIRYGKKGLFIRDSIFVLKPVESVGKMLNLEFLEVGSNIIVSKDFASRMPALKHWVWQSLDFLNTFLPTSLVTPDQERYYKEISTREAVDALPETVELSNIRLLRPYLDSVGLQRPVFNQLDTLTLFLFDKTPFSLPENLQNLRKLGLYGQGEQAYFSISEHRPKKPIDFIGLRDVTLLTPKAFFEIIGSQLILERCSINDESWKEDKLQIVVPKLESLTITGDSKFDHEERFYENWVVSYPNLTALRLNTLSLKQGPKAANFPALRQLILITTRILKQDPLPRLSMLSLQANAFFSEFTEESALSSLEILRITGDSNVPVQYFPNLIDVTVGDQWSFSPLSAPKLELVELGVGAKFYASHSSFPKLRALRAKSDVAFEIPVGGFPSLETLLLDTAVTIEGNFAALSQLRTLRFGGKTKSTGIDKMVTLYDHPYLSRLQLDANAKAFLGGKLLNLENITLKTGASLFALLGAPDASPINIDSLNMESNAKLILTFVPTGLRRVTLHKDSSVGYVNQAFQGDVPFPALEYLIYHGRGLIPKMPTAAQPIAPGLEYLEISFDENDESFDLKLQLLRTSTKLQYLELKSSGSSQEPTQLPDFPALQTLRLTGSHNITELGKMPLIQELSVDKSPLQSISHLTTLRRLAVREESSLDVSMLTNITALDMGVNTLGGMLQLKKLQTMRLVADVNEMMIRFFKEQFPEIQTLYFTTRDGVVIGTKNY